MNNKKKEAEKEKFLSKDDMEKIWIVSELFLNNIFLINKDTFERKCNTCQQKFSKTTGNSSLKKHLRAKHPKVYESIENQSEEEECTVENLKQSGEIKSPVIDINFSKTMSFSIPKKPIQKKIDEVFLIPSKEKVIKDFSLLKAVHNLPYRLFDSPLFWKAINSYSKCSDKPQISGKIIRKGVERIFLVKKKN